MNATSKLVKAWESKNAKNAAKAGGISLMALSLAACGGSSTTTTTPVVETPVVDTPTPVATTTILTTAADAVTGTANGDTLHGVVDADTAANNTLNASDVISMGNGTDTLNITFETASSAAMPSASISGVEVFNIKNVSGQTLALNMASIDGETTLNSNMSTDTVNITNIASGATGAVTGNGVVTNGASSFGYVAAATSSTINIAGGTTAGNITVTGTGLLTQTITSTGAANTTGALTNSATVTDLNINATTALTTGAISGTVLDTITITGAGAVDLDASALAATVGTVNASGASGAVSIDLGNYATDDAAASGVDLADITVTGGSGNDSLDVDGAAATLELSVNAGAGDDTVVIGADGITASSATQTGDVLAGGTGTDILSVTDTAAQAQGAVTTVSGFEELTISDASSSGGVVLTNYQAGLNVLNLAAGGAGEFTFEAGSNTLNIQDLLTGQIDVTDTGTATTDTMTIVNEDTAVDVFAAARIDSIGFETLNIVTTGIVAADGTANTAVEQDMGVINVTADTGGTATVNFSGTNAVDINGIITANVLSFAGLTAQAAGTSTVNMQAAFEYVGATGSGTITGSAGDDTLLGDTGESTNIDGGAGDDTITGGSAAETISGGAGDDTIGGGGGADTINGDAGDDTITLGGSTESVDGGAGDDTVVAAANLAFGTTIVGGAGTDSLSVNAAVAAAAGSVVSGFETLVVATHAGITVDVANFGNNSFTTIQVDDGTNATTVTSLSGEGVTVGAATLGGDLTVTLEDATGAADSQTITLSSAAAYDTTNDILVAGVETINLVMDDTNTTAHQNTIDLGADSATTINISGDAGVIFATGGNTDIADVITMNASGVVLGAVTDSGVTYAATYNTVGGTTTVTGSNGVDSLTGGTATNDTISGGSGVDTIVYTGGSDTFTGGAGNDVFDVDALGTSATHLTIADLTAGDTIEIAGIDTGTATWNATEVTLGSAATLANYLDAASAGAGNANSILRWFEFGGDTYLVNDNSAGATFASTDAVIEITGSVDLSNSTLASTVLTIV